MGKDKKSKNRGRKGRRLGAQGQQQTEDTTARNPQASNNQNKRAMDGEEEDDLIASKYVKTNTQPKQRVPAPKPAPDQTKHLEFDDSLEMELDSESSSEKGGAIVKTPEEDEWDNDSELVKQAEKTKKDDQVSDLFSKLKEVEATVHKLQRQVKSFKTKLSKFTENR
ncbi:hypothetical protein F5X96DRAFT_686416 [Biscogniauxia mediterranea]|nr:hypothetical protein F5X96DRAFT_686416 [Biscogniauxia mediterranea]